MSLLHTTTIRWIRPVLEYVIFNRDLLGVVREYQTTAEQGLIYLTCRAWYYSVDRTMCFTWCGAISPPLHLIEDRVFRPGVSPVIHALKYGTVAKESEDTEGISHIVLDNCGATLTAAHLNSCLVQVGTTLTTLVLVNVTLGPDGRKVLQSHDWFRSASQFTTLILRKVELGTKGAKTVANMIMAMPNLKVLRLLECSLMSDGGSIIGSALKMITPLRLESLSLRSDTFDSRSSIALGSGLQRSALQVIDFYKINMSMETFFPQLLKYETDLREIKLRDCSNVWDKKTTYTSHSWLQSLISPPLLPNMRYVTTLNISGCAIPDVDLKVCIPRLEFLPNLYELNLSRTLLSDEGIATLQALLVKTSIGRVSIAECSNVNYGALTAFFTDFHLYNSLTHFYCCRMQYYEAMTGARDKIKIGEDDHSGIPNPYTALYESVRKCMRMKVIGLWTGNLHRDSKQQLLRAFSIAGVQLQEQQLIR